ncbi:unnamed protein product [Caenorhabditis sp. 36 PRJEB53466]|nr:unnamed protein product [Caenorhabditis sp. 36 PRJEB53466]
MERSKVEELKELADWYEGSYGELQRKTEQEKTELSHLKEQLEVKDRKIREQGTRIRALEERLRQRTDLENEIDKLNAEVGSLQTLAKSTACLLKQQNGKCFD